LYLGIARSIILLKLSAHLHPTKVADACFKDADSRRYAPTMIGELPNCNSEAREHFGVRVVYDMPSP
jgi:hypothetical protein